MITIKASNDKMEYNKIWQALFEFNKEKDSSLTNDSYCVNDATNFYAYDGDELIGGIMCDILFNWLYIDILYVDEKMRGQDIGSMLMKEAEKFVKDKNLTGMYLLTADFQARPFYEKCGFEVCGCIEDMPPGSKMWILKKNSYIIRKLLSEGNPEIKKEIFEEKSLKNDEHERSNH